MKKDKRKARDKDGIKQEGERRKMRHVKQANREGMGKRQNLNGECRGVQEKLLIIWRKMDQKT